MMTQKQVVPFQEGNASMKALLGGKGANLAEMTRAGLPVPPGFTITTEACLAFFKVGNRISDELLEQVAAALKQLEKQKGTNVRRCKQSASCFRTIRFCKFDAGDDGYDFESWSQRRNRSRVGSAYKQ